MANAAMAMGRMNWVFILVIGRVIAAGDKWKLCLGSWSAVEAV